MPWVVDKELTIQSIDVKPNLCELTKPIEVDISYKLANCLAPGATWKVQVLHLCTVHILRLSVLTVRAEYIMYFLGSLTCPDCI